MNEILELFSVVTHPVFLYLILGGFLFADAFIPVVPTQALMITTGILAAHDKVSLTVAIIAGASGMFLGDFACFLLGRRAKRSDDVPQRRLVTRVAGRLVRRLHRSGPPVIFLCRFVPSGRMMVGFHAGKSRYPYRKYVTYELVAAFAWATYAGLVGQIGGAAISEAAWAPFVIAAAGAAVFAAAGWLLAISTPASPTETVAEVPLPAPAVVEEPAPVDVPAVPPVAATDVTGEDERSAPERMAH